MTDRRCCEGSINPGSGPDCGPWCVDADFDPLALPAAYFEGLPTGVPNNLPMQPEPVEVPRVTEEAEVILIEFKATARDPRNVGLTPLGWFTEGWIRGRSAAS